MVCCETVAVVAEPVWRIADEQVCVVDAGGAHSGHWPGVFLGEEEDSRSAHYVRLARRCAIWAIAEISIHAVTVLRVNGYRGLVHEMIASFGLCEGFECGTKMYLPGCQIMAKQAVEWNARHVPLTAVGSILGRVVFPDDAPVGAWKKLVVVAHV